MTTEVYKVPSAGLGEMAPNSLITNVQVPTLRDIIQVGAALPSHEDGTTKLHIERRDNEISVVRYDDPQFDVDQSVRLPIQIERRDTYSRLHRALENSVSSLLYTLMDDGEWTVSAEGLVIINDQAFQSFTNKLGTGIRKRQERGVVTLDK